MAVVKSWSGNGLTAGTLTTSSAGTGDTPFQSVTGTLNVDVSGGRTQIRVPDGTGAAYAAWTLGSLSAYAIRFDVTQSTTGAIICQVNDGVGDKAAGFDFNTGGALRLSAKQNGTNVNLWVASAAYPADTRIRGEYTETAAGAWTVAYYLGDSTAPVQSGSGTKTQSQSAATFWAGRISGAVASSNLRLGNLAVGDTATPLGPAAAATVDPVWYRYDGTTWLPVQMYRN